MTSSMLVRETSQYVHKVSAAPASKILRNPIAEHLAKDFETSKIDARYRKPRQLLAKHQAIFGSCLWQRVTDDPLDSPPDPLTCDPCQSQRADNVGDPKIPIKTRSKQNPLKFIWWID